MRDLLIGKGKRQKAEGKKRLASLLVFAFCILPCAFAAQADTPLARREAALAADAKFDTTAALAALDDGLKRFPNDPGLLAAKGRIYWRLMRTQSAEEALIAAAKSPEYAAEANYFLGVIYDFKGSHAEGAFPGFHEEVSYRPRAAAAFAAAGTPKPEWTATLQRIGPALKAADETIARLQSSRAPRAELHAAIEKRLAIRPDPVAYLANANLLVARLDEGLYLLSLASDGLVAGNRFIHENESSYKLDGKVQASIDRNEAAFLDISGWQTFLLGNVPVAEQRLVAAARRYRNADATNQIHLASVSIQKNDPDTAREHFLTALGLAGITPRQREETEAALAVIQENAGENPADFKKWLTATLDRKREERRKALVSSMQGRKLPDLVLKDLQGNTVDLRAERGNVVLLNFFSAW